MFIVILLCHYFCVHLIHLYLFYNQKGFKPFWIHSNVTKTIIIIIIIIILVRCRTPLDEGSACCRDFYLTTHNTRTSQTYMPPAGFEPPISASGRPHTHALGRAATGIGDYFFRDGL